MIAMAVASSSMRLNCSMRSGPYRVDQLVGHIQFNARFGDPECQVLMAGLPGDIVPAIAFLASEEAHWITGQALAADAGMVRW